MKRHLTRSPRLNHIAPPMLRTFCKNLLKLSVVALIFLPSLAFSDEASIGVAAFTVNGPADLQYLSQAAQDAVVGALVKRGKFARALTFKLEPDRLITVAQGKGKDSLLLAGRINIVGQTYRVLLKWVDTLGQSGQEYLEVGDVNQLLPQLESFAANRLKVPATAVAQVPAPIAPVEKTMAAPSKSQAPLEIAAPVPVATPPSKVKQPKETKITVYEEAPPAKSAKSGTASTKPASRVIPIPGESHDDYMTISQRLPFEVRALAYGDVNGDGQDEILLTSQTELFAYRNDNGTLTEIARYTGKKLDHFVKVGIWPGADAGKPYIVLTNLRGDQAASELLRFDGKQFSPVVREIPYQLRVVEKEGRPLLLGETYSAGASTRHQVYELQLADSKVKTAGKFDLPSEIGLYSFEFLPSGSSEFALAGLTASGKLKLYKKEENGKYKGAWTSRDSYGGSANDVEVNVKDFFNEVVANYYVVPLGIRALPGRGAANLVVAKNDALLKEIVGRKPVISDGRMVQLQWSSLGMNEAWSSKKVDGSILDYQLNDVGGQTQLMVAVRMRDTGFFEGVGKRKDSVLLVYKLN